MRYILTVMTACAGILAMKADEPKATIVPHINSSGNISVEQPDGLEQRLEFDASNQSSESNKNARATSVGYRVEVFADNNARTAKSQALARRRNISARLPQYDTYMVFESPYWRVRVGDFKSKSEAEHALAEIRKAFPAYSHDLRIIRSRIKN